MLINSANKRNISQSPDVAVDVSLGIQMFFQKIVIQIITKINHNGLLEEESSTLNTMGTRVTQTPRQLAIKPEGERNWKWSDLFIPPGSGIKDDDILLIQNIKYRVMSSSANQEYGCMKYELLEDYENAG